jgi:hypothetical protein
MKLLEKEKMCPDVDLTTVGTFQQVLENFKIKVDICIKINLLSDFSKLTFGTTFFVMVKRSKVIKLKLSYNK